MYSFTNILLDLFFLAIIAVSFIIGYKRGGVKIIFSFFSLLISAYLSYVLYNPVADFMAKVFLNNGSNLKDKIIFKVVVLLILFLFLSVALGIVVRIVNKILSFSFIGKLNKLLGAIIGTLCGLIIAYIICFALSLAQKNGIDLPLGLTDDTVNNSLFFSIFM